MKESQRFLAKGKSCLARREMAPALGNFERALKLCPVGSRRQLADILFYLGVTMLKLGDPDAALRSFAAGSRVLKRAGRCYGMVRRLANCYGMVRQGCPDEDDRRAFCAIQMRRYLQTKPSGRIGTAAERDMVADLIHEHWRGLKEAHPLAGLDAQRKLALFCAVTIVFPALACPKSLAESVIPVNFIEKRRISAAERCLCGSGLPYMTCCGRTSEVSARSGGAN